MEELTIFDTAALYRKPYDCEGSTRMNHRHQLLSASTGRCDSSYILTSDDNRCTT
jgi:hypothetical protein